MPNKSTSNPKARAIGINHVALAVGDLQEALDFYSQLVTFELRGRGDGHAFIDLGDQFIALFEAQNTSVDQNRHFGLVVDDKALVKQRLNAIGVEMLPGPFLDFRDPWGNRVQIVEYREIQFTKAPQILAGMGLSHLKKSSEAIEALADKGMAEKKP
ncbi:VOC family protein [Methylohalobius crimeensis]|uniref:VOC family protein n=1 Tax=Methylohalobius crimeensis TaxID=244365 RepID=UPI0003B338AC|nr:VOC family protein [Methylohalobius crimeensis]